MMIPINAFYDTDNIEKLVTADWYNLSLAGETFIDYRVENSGRIVLKSTVAWSGDKIYLIAIMGKWQT